MNTDKPVFEIRREVTQGVSYRGAMIGREVTRVRYVVYMNGATFCPFTSRAAAELCVLQMEKDSK